MCKRLGQSDVLKEISDFLRFKKRKSMLSNDVDDVFRRMVAAELKQLPEENKRFVKREITAILYCYQTAGAPPTNLQDEPHCSRVYEDAQERFSHPQSAEPAATFDVPNAFYNM